MKRPRAAATSRSAGYWRESALLLVLVLPLVLLFNGDPIAQDPRYHALADERTLLGVPNFFNVASNIAFLLVAVPGLLLAFSRRRSGAWRSWAVFFGGVALVGFGSAWYHWAPSSGSLVWDRLPMTLAFMGLFAAVLSEHVGEKLERLLLPPALAVGLASVLWWHYADDLRLYIWVQASPLLIVLLLLTAFAARYSHRACLLYALGFYVMAKLAELYDREIFVLSSQAVSGHTMKHLLAAASALLLWFMLRRRRPLPGDSQARSLAPQRMKRAA
jgi:hypothetical protein